jgi:hypothetical protein
MHALGLIGVVFPVKNNWDRMITLFWAILESQMKKRTKNLESI